MQLFLFTFITCPKLLIYVLFDNLVLYTHIVTRFMCVGYR